MSSVNKTNTVPKSRKCNLTGTGFFHSFVTDSDIYSDDASHSSSTFYTASEKLTSNHLESSLPLDGQPSSSFEDLLLGFLTQNESLQTVSQNCSTSNAVESTGKQAHAEFLNDSSSDYSDADISTEVCMVVESLEKDEDVKTSCLPADVSDDGNKPTAASELCDCADGKSEMLHSSTKRNEDEKVEELTFEELLYGVISQSECSQVESQKSETVKSKRKQVTQADVCKSSNDSTGSSSNAGVLDVSSHFRVNTRHSTKSDDRHLAETGTSLSSVVSHSYDKSTASCHSKFCVANSSPIDNKTDALQSGHKRSRDKSLRIECGASLNSMPQSFGVKLGQKRQQKLAVASFCEPFHYNRNTNVLLRMMHRTLNMNGAARGKMSAREIVRRWFMSGVDNVRHTLSGEPGYCDAPKKTRKHEKRKMNEKLADGFAQFESSPSPCPRKIRPPKCVSSLVDGKRLQRKEIGTPDGETVIVENNYVPVASVSHDTEGELSRCCILPTYCDDQNSHKKQVLSDCSESKGLQSAKKKTKRKRNFLHDEVVDAELQKPTNDELFSICAASVHAQDISMYSDKDEFIQSSELEKQETFCKKCRKNDVVEDRSTPQIYGTKAFDECVSPSILCDGKSVTIPLTVTFRSADKRTTRTAAAASCSTKTGQALLNDISSGVVNSGENVLHEEDLSDKCVGTCLSENMPLQTESGENEFEQLLLNVLDVDKSPAVSKERSGSGRHEVSLTDSDGNDVDELDVSKQANSRPSAVTDVFGSSTGKSQESDLKGDEFRSESVSQDCNTCCSDGSPSLLNRTPSHFNAQCQSQDVTRVKLPSMPAPLNVVLTPEKAVTLFSAHTIQSISQQIFVCLYDASYRTCVKTLNNMKYGTISWEID